MSVKSKQKNCPEGKYWIHSYSRKAIDKNGKPYIQEVSGYCCSYRSPFHKIADEEKMPLDLVYFALTIYGESRDQNDASRRAIHDNSESFQKIWKRILSKSCTKKKSVFLLDEIRS